MKVSKARIRPIVMATFPDYKGRKFQIEPTTKLTFYNLNWSGGSKNFYTALRIDMATAKLVPNAPWNEPREGLRIEMTHGMVVVRHTYFCGVDMGITVYAHPDLMPKLLKGANSSDNPKA